MGSVVCKIEDRRRVYSVSHEASLEVEVRTCAAASATTQSDRLSGFHCLIGFNKMFVKVSVNSLKTIGVTDDYVFALNFAFVGGETYFAVECSVDCVVAADCKVDTFVHSAELGAITIV